MVKLVTVKCVDQLVMSSILITGIDKIAILPRLIVIQRRMLADQFFITSSAFIILFIDRC